MRFLCTQCGVPTSYKRVVSVCAYVLGTASVAVHKFDTVFLQSTTWEIFTGGIIWAMIVRGFDSASCAHDQKRTES